MEVERNCKYCIDSPPTLQIVLKIRAYKNHYSVEKGHFRLEAVEKSLFHETWGIKTALSTRIYYYIFFYKFVELTSKFLIQIHTRKESPPVINVAPLGY